MRQQTFTWHDDLNVPWPDTFCSFVRDTFRTRQSDRPGLNHYVVVATCRFEMVVFAPVDSLTDDDGEVEVPRVAEPSPKAKGKAKSVKPPVKTLPPPPKRAPKAEAAGSKAKAKAASSKAKAKAASGKATAKAAAAVAQPDAEVQQTTPVKVNANKACTRHVKISWFQSK